MSKFEIVSTEGKHHSFQDLTGNRYSRLKVIGLSPRKSGRKSYWVCECDCGKKHLARSDSLKAGRVQSCGCLRDEKASITAKNKRTHRESHTHLHDTWLGIKKRCLNKNSNSYDRYGKRGISVCDEWVDSYEAFRNWALDNGYKEGLTIERINNDGDYSPENCTWIPFHEQANNRRNTVWVEYKGKKQNLKQWADELGFNYGTLNSRYNKYGKRPPELFEPVRRKRKYRGK